MVLRKLLSGGLKGEKRECKSPSKASPSTSIEYSVDDAFCQGDGTRPTHFIFGDDASPSSKRLSSRGGSMTELGRFLRQAEAEKGSDDDQQTFDQTTQTTLDGVEIYEYNAPRDGYSTLPVEMSMFSLSLLKYDIGPEYDSLAERIVKNGLRRHVEHHFNAPMDRVKSRTMPFSGININECLKKDPEKVESLARELITCAEYDEAIVLYKLLLRRQSKKRKGESADTLSKLSILCLLVGDTKTALSYGQRALRLRREESRQAQIAICLHQLGLVYFCGKKPEKALDAWREALQIICLVFGYDHPYVATLLNNLGCLHYHEGNFPVSLKTFFESLDLNRKFLGASVGGTNSIILDMAITKTNIATISARKGNMDIAVSLLEEVLALQESVVDSGHFLVKATVVTIDRLTEYQGTENSLPTTSLKPFRGTTSIASKTHDTSEAAAVQTCATSQFIEVEDYRPSIFGDCDGIPMRRIGAKSPLDTIDSTDTLDIIMLGSLVNEYTPRRRIRAAILGLFGRTLQHDEDRKLPSVPFAGTPRKRINLPVDLDHNTIIDAELRLQEVYEQAADYLEHDEVDEALELFKGVLSSHRDKYGDLHHLIGTANHNIGLIYLFAQQYPQAMSYFREALTVREAALGPEHPAVAASLMKIGMLFQLQRETESAKNTFIRILKLARKSLGHNHIQVPSVLNNIAIAHYEQGAYLDAFRTLQEAHEIQRRLLLLAQSEISLLDQTRTIELALSYTLSNIAFLYCRQKKYKDSLKMFQEADKLRTKHADISMPDVGCTDENLRYVRALVTDIERKELKDQDEAGGNIFKAPFRCFCAQ